MGWCADIFKGMWNIQQHPMLNVHERARIDHGKIQVSVKNHPETFAQHFCASAKNAASVWKWSSADRCAPRKWDRSSRSVSRTEKMETKASEWGWEEVKLLFCQNEVGIFKRDTANIRSCGIEADPFWKVSSQTFSFLNKAAASASHGFV